jgi:hypothetical protein
MILGFKPQFPPLIERGTKVHTIREDKKDRWKEGNLIHFATGVRTPKMNIFRTQRCEGIQKIKIVWRDGALYPEIDIDGRRISINEQHTLARNDGFEKPNDFYDWFNTNFEGKIIHWTTFKYE